MFKIAIRKLIVLIIGYPIYLFSFFTPRNRKKIVVGSHTPFNDNSKYFFLLAKQYLPEYSIIWITNKQGVKEKIQRLGLKAHKIYSLKGLYHALTAKYYIYSFHLIDINFWTSGRSIKFNLWHGIPLKDIAFAIKSGPSKSIYNEKNVFSWIIRPHVFVRPNYMVTTSDKMSDYFSRAFRIKKEQCLKYGMPRCDIFSWEKEKIMNFITSYESNEMIELVKSFSNYKKVFIYMPTWREEVDFLFDAGFDFKKMNEVLKKENKLFIFKLHPFTKLKKIKLAKLNTFSNLVVLNDSMDVYPILPFTDCLISDYSSIYYDYLLLEGKAIYLFPFDYEKYITKSRDLAFDYERQMPGYRINDFDDMLNILLRNKHKYTDEQLKIKKEYFETIGQSSVKLLSNFIKKLEAKME